MEQVRNNEGLNQGDASENRGKDGFEVWKLVH